MWTALPDSGWNILCWQSKLGCQIGVCVLQVRVHTDGEAAGTTFEINPDKPFQKDLIVSSQPGILDDFHSGLNNTMFSLVSVQPVGELAVRFTVDLFCDRTATPWCEDGQGTGKG